MPYTVNLPDGRTVEFPDSVSREAATAIIRKQLGFGAKPESGGYAALKAGIEGLRGAKSALSGKLGFTDMAQAEAEIAASKKRAAEIFKPTEEGWTEAPGTKFAELLGGSAPYMALPLAAAAGAAALPLTGVAATAAGLGAAGLASLGQFTGTGLRRQMEGEEGSVPTKTLAETSLPSAFAAAIPSALLDTLSMRMIPGIGRMLGQAGVKVTAETAKEIAEQGLKKTLADYTLKTGKAAGVEGATEAAQQVFERLQAGLSITNEKARDEYFESFLGGAILGGTLAPAGRFIERGGEQREARGLLEKKAQEERTAAAAAEKARRESPEYILGVAKEYETLNQQQAELQAKLIKGSKEKPLSQEDNDRNAVIKQQLTALGPAIKDAKKRYLALGGPDAVQKARESTLELTAPPGRVSEPPAVTEVPGEEEAPEAKFARAQQESQGLATLLEQQREQIAAATTPEEMLTLAQRAQKTEAALADAQKILAARPQPPDTASIEAALAKAQEAGDTANVIKYAQQLIAARAAAPAAESGLFAPEAIAAEEARRTAAEEARRQAAIEEARRNPTPAQRELLAEGEAEREGMQERAQTLATQQRQRENAEFRTSQQTTLLPESQQRIERTEGGDRAILGRSVRERIAALEQERRELLNLQETGPTPESATLWGPLSAPSAARKRVQAIDQELTRIQKATQREGVTTTTTGMPMPLDQAQIDTRPQPKLQEQVATLLERVGTDPKTDTETQDLAARVQDQLPAVLRQLQIQSQEEAKQTRERLAGTSQAGRTVQMAAQLDPLPMVYEWAQSVRSGTPAPDLTRKLTTALQTLERGQLSETEQVTQQTERGTTPLERSEMVGTSMEGRATVTDRAPTGEIARASQMDLEMPEPTATSFGSFKELNDYLASEGLQALRLQKGLVFPTLANLQKRLAPLQARIQALSEQARVLNERRDALLKGSAAERKAAEQRYRDTQKALQQEIETLDEIARITYTGKGVRQVDLVDLLDQAHKRLNEGLAQSNELRTQFAASLKSLAAATQSLTPVMVDAQGRVTTEKADAVRSVAQGQIPGYQALRKTQLALQEKGFALVAADKKLAEVVQAEVDAGGDVRTAAKAEYARAKKARDEAQREAQQAHYAMLQAYKRVPSAETLNNNLTKFLSEKATLDGELARAARMLSGLRGQVSKASNRLNASYIAFETRPEFGFSESLDRLRQDLSAAQKVRSESRGREAVAQQDAERLKKESLTLANPKNLLERQVRTALSEAQQRAEQRRAPPVVAGETQSEREARDGEERKAEQARLERAETGPREQVAFEGGIRYQAKDDQRYIELVQQSLKPGLTSEQRIAAGEAADAYLAKKEAEREEADAARPAAVAKKEADIAAAEASIAKRQDQLAKVHLSRREKAAHKDDPAKQEEVLAGKRQKIEAAIKVDQEKLANHKRLLGIARGYPKVTRTDPADIRAYREKLAAEIQRGFEPGKRLGVEEGTQKRGIGPVTRNEVTPPRTLRTGSEESVAGVTTTTQKNPLSEVRGVKQRDLPMKPAEMAAANKAAAAMRTVEVVDKERRDLIAKNKAAKERGYAEGEQERFVEQLAILERRKEALKADEAALAKKKLNATAEIAKNRSRINEINTQLAFIQDNPAQTKEGVDKQTTTKKTLTMEREKLAGELRELYKTQTAVETEAKKAAKEDVAESAKKTPGRKAKGQELFAEEKTGVTPATRKKLETAATTTVEGGVKTTRIPYAGNERFAEEGDLSTFVPEILGGEREDVFLSRGATENPSTTADVRAELGKVFPDLGRVQIFDSVEALVAANPQYKGKIPSDARGFVDTAGNKAFLIAENIEQGQAMGVLLHEVGAHIGLKNMLGDAQYNALVKAVEAWEKRNDGSVESRVAKAARARVEAAETEPGHINDELLAYAVEEAVSAGVSPTATKSPLGQWLARIAQAFRKALEKFGLPAKALDAQGLVDMAFGAAKMEMRPAVTQLSRRQFLRGAGAALGALKLPPLSKGMQLDALEAAWDASLDAASTWFDAAKAAAKTTATKNLVSKYGLNVDNDTFVEATAGVSNDLYEALHYMEYGPENYGTHLRDYLKDKGVSAVAELQQALQAQRAGLVQAVQKAAKESGLPEVGELYFSKNLPTASRVANNLVGKEKGWVDYLRDNFLGMGFRAQFVDKLAPIEEALKKGGVSTIKALQAMYFLRMYDQRMHITSEAMTEGVSEVVEKARKDGGTERIIQTKPGANIKKVVDILKQKDVIKAAGSADAANKLFTLYLAAIRAERVGAQTLNFGGKVTDADLKAARAEIEADPVLKKAFGEARDIYNQYNRNLLEFSVQTGAISRDVANKLLADNDYIPYYRIRDGVAQMVIGNETPIRIGNLKDSPHLKELVKGDEAIFDFLTSSVQNTAMLLDMAMKNLATKNAMFELRDVGLATISKVPKSGKTPEGAVTFKRDGEDYFAIVDTDTIGIDSDLLVKGMAGIPTMFPSIVRLLGIPARLLRRTVVASPVYMARQLFRDSLAASMTSGANITPVLGALRQIGKADVLRGRGITGGQVFTGMPEDVTRMLKEMQAGRVGVSSGLAWLEAKSAQMDSLTRRAQYQSYLDQGLSEMEATFMALESMNFSKRGLSPTMHMVSTLIPFFNAQIQGLDVLYKAFTGKMPMNERLAIREKLMVRGAMMFGMSIAYAMAMQDEEEYKNARPEEKYGNWFVRVPGFDEMVRLPIPFELGYVFKALPEALVNIMVNEKGGEEAAKAAKHFATQMVPGLSNYYLPQAVKPGLEVALNKSIYTGRDIESTKEQMVEPGLRYRDNTTAAAQEIGEFLNISPVKMEYLIRGYTGSMGMALLAAVSAPFGSDEGPQAATKRMSDMPVIGTLFQPKDASGIIDATYDRMKEVNTVKATYDDLIEKGRIEDAQKFLSTRTNEMALASVAGSFREYMGQIAEYERGIKASNMTPDEKREKLDAAKQMKIRLATAVRAVADKKEPQAAPA